MFRFPSPSALPTPLDTDKACRKRVRDQLLDGDEDGARPPPPLKARARHSIQPIFEEYKRRRSNESDVYIDQLRNQRHNQSSSSSAPEPPLVLDLKNKYAALRATLHSNGMWDVTNIEEALVAEAEEKFNANVSTLNEIASKARELSASSLDLEVDIKISRDNGESTNRTVRLREELSRYQELGDERAKQLDQLWSSWETAQADVDELSGELHGFFERKPSSETSGMSSNREWADSEDIDIERRSKQVVEDMVACEEKFQEKLKDEETNILEAMLKCSLG